MNDTSIKMQRVQFEIYQSKSIDEKFRMVAEMMEYGFNQTKTVLKGWHPQKSESELQIEFFKVYYRNDLNAEKMNHFINIMEKKPIYTQN